MHNVEIHHNSCHYNLNHGWKRASKYNITLVTHILRQARKLADQIIFMYLGEIVEAGPADEFFKNPQKQLTKDYMTGSFS